MVNNIKLLALVCIIYLLAGCANCVLPTDRELVMDPACQTMVFFANNGDVKVGLGLGQWIVQTKRVTIETKEWRITAERKELK